MKTTTEKKNKKGSEQKRSGRSPIFRAFGICKELFVRKFSGIDKNLYLFQSFGGHYSDSPKYISESLHALDPGAKITWILSTEYIKDAPDYVIPVLPGSKDEMRARRHAVAIIDNVYGQSVYFRSSDCILHKAAGGLFSALSRKRGQRVFTTWHGTPLKRMGRDQVGSDIKGFYGPDIELLMGNRFTMEIMDHLTFGKTKPSLIGCPRNDLMFSSDEKKTKIKERLGLPADKKIVLYAPTFRSSGSDISDVRVKLSGVSQIEEMDVNAVLSALGNKFGGEFVLVLRLHYHVLRSVNMAELSESSGGRVINGNLFDDMAEYLAVTDVLLTDASSCMFDISLAYKPCFLLFPDVDNYKERERGLYTEISDLPFPLAKNTDELVKAISCFDPCLYRERVERMNESYGYADDGEASVRVAKYILSRCKNEKNHK